MTEIIKALRNPIVGKNTLADKLQRKYAPESMSQSSSQPSSDPTPECVVRYTSFVHTDVTFSRRLATTIEREVYKTSSNREKETDSLNSS